MRRTGNWADRAAVCGVALCCVFTATIVQAQSKKSAKQAANLEKSGDAAKTAVQDVLTSVNGLLAGYNSIIDGEAEDNQKAYKKLVGDLKTTEKKTNGAKKKLASLSKDADKFFKAWEVDLQSISSESLRDKSAARMNDSKKRFAEIGEILTAASNEFAPVVQNLKDQILYLGRDLSPAAIADLGDEAAELNQQADAATARVKEMLEKAGNAKAEADAELESTDIAADDE